MRKTVIIIIFLGSNYVYSVKFSRFSGRSIIKRRALEQASYLLWNWVQETLINDKLKCLHAKGSFNTDSQIRGESGIDLKLKVLDLNEKVTHSVPTTLPIQAAATAQGSMFEQSWSLKMVG